MTLTFTLHDTVLHNAPYSTAPPSTTALLHCTHCTASYCTAMYDCTHCSTVFHITITYCTPSLYKLTHISETMHSLSTSEVSPPYYHQKGGVFISMARLRIQDVANFTLHMMEAGRLALILYTCPLHLLHHVIAHNGHVTLNCQYVHSTPT